MTRQQYTYIALTLSMLVFLSEAVLSCTLEGTAEQVHADAVATLNAYHLPTIGLALGILAVFLLRRFRGLLILLFAFAALAISPGWSPDTNAVTLANCRPKGELGVQIVLGVMVVCFVAQLVFLIVEKRKPKPDPQP